MNPNDSSSDSDPKNQSEDLHKWVMEHNKVETPIMVMILNGKSGVIISVTLGVIISHIN